MTNWIALFLCLSIVENGPRHDRGEFGKTCITQVVVNDFNARHKMSPKVTLTMTDSDEMCRVVTIDQLRYYRDRFVRDQKREPMARELAAMWRSGYHGAVVHGNGRIYGTRVEALYEESTHGRN